MRWSLLAQPGNVDTVVVDGRILRRKNQFTALDHAKVMQDAATTIAALRARKAVKRSVNCVELERLRRPEPDHVIGVILAARCRFAACVKTVRPLRLSDQPGDDVGELLARRS